MPAAQLRFGLAANRLHHETPDAALFSWLRACSSTIRELGVQLHTVGRTHDAIVREGMLQGYSGLIRYPYGREGGLMKLVARVTEGRDGDAPFDGAIYLIDPVDPSSIFPEALALKRQCITHGRPFISTLAGAIEWMEVERVHAGLAPDASVSRLFNFTGQTLALIAHDALKDEMTDDLAPFGPLVATDLSRGEDIESMAAAILSDAPDRFVAVGFSMGGYVARELARIAPEIRPRSGTS